MFFEININKRNLRVAANCVEDILPYLPTDAEYNFDITLDAVAWDTVCVSLTPNYDGSVMGRGWSTLDEDVVWHVLSEIEESVSSYTFREDIEAAVRGWKEVEEYFSSL